VIIFIAPGYYSDTLVS